MDEGNVTPEEAISDMSQRDMIHDLLGLGQFMNEHVPGVDLSDGPVQPAIDHMRKMQGLIAAGIAALQTLAQAFHNLNAAFSSAAESMAKKPE